LGVLRDLAGDSDVLIAEHAAWAIAEIERRTEPGLEISDQ
jgi:hypothetical protein